MRRRVIIGVIGGSNQVSPEVTRRAGEIGSAVGAQDAILLTGGAGGSDTVKDAAVDGAAGARIISILKGGRGIERRGDRHILVHSGLRDARNVLNAFAADVLIALRGGGGTLSEVAFAAIAGRPVLFLDGSRVHLRGFITGMADIAQQAVTAFGDTRFTDTNLQRAVTPVLDNPSNDARNVDDAIRRSLAAPRAGMLPDIPDQPEAVRDYIAALREMDV